MKHTIGLILNKRKHKQQKQQKTQTMPDMITFYDGWSGYTMALFSPPEPHGVGQKRQML